MHEAVSVKVHNRRARESARACGVGVNPRRAVTTFPQFPVPAGLLSLGSLLSDMTGAPSRRDYRRETNNRKAERNKEKREKFISRASPPPRWRCIFYSETRCNFLRRNEKVKRMEIFMSPRSNIISFAKLLLCVIVFSIVDFFAILKLQF